MAICSHPTPPVCTCLLLASGDRLDQDWWFLLGVVGTAPGETKGVWEKNNTLAQVGGWVGSTSLPSQHSESRGRGMGV